MNDDELRALSAYVGRETLLMHTENEERYSNGYAPAYTFETGGLSDAMMALEAELIRREILPVPGESPCQSEPK